MTDGQPPTAVWLAEQGIGAPVDYNVHGGTLARRAAEQAEREAERAEALRQAQREEERDRRLTAQYLAGVQPGAAIQRALAIQDLETEISSRQAEIDKLARRRERLLQEGRDQDAAVSRSVAMVEGPAPADGVEGAAQRAAEALRQVEAERRVDAMLARRRATREREARRSASPPKVRGGSCVCGAADCDAYPDDPDSAERARVDDLMAKGYSWEMAHLAYTPADREITRSGGPVVSVR